MTKRTSRKRHSRKRTSKKNGYSRRASRGLKGKRRSRSKRTSRRNMNYDYTQSHPWSYDSRGRPRRNSRRPRRNSYVAPGSKFEVQYPGGTWGFPTRKKAVAFVAGMTPEDRAAAIVRKSEASARRPRRNSRKRTSRRNQTFYIPIPPIKKNKRKRTSRRNGTVDGAKVTLHRRGHGVFAISIDGKQAGNVIKMKTQPGVWIATGDVAGSTSGTTATKAAHDLARILIRDYEY